MTNDPDGSTGNGAAAPSTPLGSIQRIDELTVLVLGQELNVEAKQPDVANALVHRAGDTLVIVDTGVTELFRDALRQAVNGFAEAKRLLLLTTHGHTDHVGNNDLIDEIAKERGIAAEHFVPARDIGQMLDPVDYWTNAFSNIIDLTSMPAPADMYAAFVVSLFQPLRPFGATTRTYEELPMQRLELGRLPVNGWSFADGAVSVLRSQGHCAGHVMVYFRDSRLLHLGDEDNGPCGSMADADQVKVQTAFGLAVSLIDSGDVDTITDGHSTVRSGAQAREFLDDLLEQAVAVQALALPSRSGMETVEGRAFLEQLTERFNEHSADHTAPNPVFTAMLAVNELTEAGLVRQGGATSWNRPKLTNPAPVAAKPHGLAMLPAAAEMLRWKLRRTPGA
jgi:glyoxylase-like metal-dependent hydrolase (beta-lactamase superfamily II)